MIPKEYIPEIMKVDGRIDSRMRWMNGWMDGRGCKDEEDVRW